MDELEKRNLEDLMKENSEVIFDSESIEYKELVKEIMLKNTNKELILNTKEKIKKGLLNKDITITKIKSDEMLLIADKKMIILKKGEKYFFCFNFEKELGRLVNTMNKIYQEMEE